MEVEITQTVGAVLKNLTDLNLLQSTTSQKHDISLFYSKISVLWHMATFHLAIHYYPYTGVKYRCKHILSQKSSAIFQASTWWRHRKLLSAEIKTKQASQCLTAFALCARTLFGTLLVGIDSRGTRRNCSGPCQGHYSPVYSLCRNFPLSVFNGQREQL